MPTAVPDLDWVCFTFLPRLERVASNFWISPSTEPYLLILRIAASAVSLASRKILLAFWLASCKMASRCASSLACFFSTSARMLAMWARSAAMAARSFSMATRFCSKSLIKSSKERSFSSRRCFASSTTSLPSPNLEEMAKALLLPGIPINNR